MVLNGFDSRLRTSLAVSGKPEQLRPPLRVRWGTYPTMSVYQNDWREAPPGYYADPEVRARHDRRVREERRWARLVENELGKMGYERDEIPSREDVERAEEAARRRL